MVRNNHSKTRRNVIRSVAGIGGLSVVPLAASRARAAESQEETRYYEIADDGDLVYVGPNQGRNNYLASAVDGFNEAKDSGEIRFEERDDRVNIIPVDSSDSVSILGCKGKDDYETKLHWQGLRHIFWFDDCTSTELRNKLAGGAILSEVVAVVANAAPGVGQGAAAVAAVAGILMGGGAGLITANNEGSGIKLWFHGPNIADIDVYEIRPQ
ncbi:hypothetical protein [Natrinema halophilum]|uniref:Uncharacterized protein n=1 Tax=Natrinema halophilum TaxID=1699371 RepID=A0A7D5GIP0_9EURY|nr:hypothetical protein [Natrinema halophilum]QLG49847.1 hypothetical protein HYG82_13765 [Natrinema halophilum]